MKIKIVNYENNTARVIDYPATLKTFISVHYSAWGFFRVCKAGAGYDITCPFTGELLYTVCKA